jgi:fructokinase
MMPTPPDPFDPVPDAVAVGTGRLTLDVIVRDGEPPRSQAGGTCGNVLCNLAYLGWQVHPLTDLGDDDPGERFCSDLTRWGVHLDLIRRIPCEQTPVIIHHIRDTDHGAVHSFSSRCPFCGRKLRYYEPVAADAVRQRLPIVPDAKAFFFDRDSEGALLLARHCRDRGALVVYEPNYAGKESNLDGALAVAHVLKFSRERLPDLLNRPLDGPGLIVETLGANGLNYLDRREPSAQWRTMPAIGVPVVRDAGGAGDWTTAGFLHLAGLDGYAGFQALSPDDLLGALRFGQALGAWNCAFEGARGGVYQMSRERWRQDIERLLAGEVFDPLEGSHASTHDLAGSFCPGCGGKAGSR